MQKLILLSLAALLFFAFETKAVEIPFEIYSDKDAVGNHFVPGGWMGDTADLKLDDKFKDFSASGVTCIKLVYKAKQSSGQGWAGIYWQSAEGNWGTRKTGFDLSGYNKLNFKARGAKGGEIISKVKVGGIIFSPTSGEKVAYPDSTSVEAGPFQLSLDWQEFSINLAGQDLSYINGGMVLTFSSSQISTEQTVYLDDIKFVNDESLTVDKPLALLPFSVHSDASSLDNHFVPSGWMPATAAQDLEIDAAYKINPHSGETCTRIDYKNTSGTRWAGLYWQNPAGNWGDIPNAGYNLTGARKLTFWARGEKGSEVINEFKMGGITNGAYVDTDSAGIGPVTLTSEWKQYEIDLTGKDLSYIIGGFCYATNIDVNPEGATFYIDDIRYE